MLPAALLGIFILLGSIALLRIIWEFMLGLLLLANSFAIVRPVMRPFVGMIVVDIGAGRGDRGIAQMFVLGNAQIGVAAIFLRFIGRGGC